MEYSRENIFLIDLDGTLLDDKKNISDEDIYWLNKVYKEKDVLPIISTARPFASALHIAGKVGQGLKQYIISDNGALLTDVKNNNCVYSKSIPNAQLLELVTLCEKLGLDYNVTCQDNTLVTERYLQKNRNVLDTYKNIGLHLAVSEDIRDSVKDVISTSFLAVGVEDEISRHKGVFEENFNNSTTKVTSTEKKTLMTKDLEGNDEQLYYFCITPVGITKSSAIQALIDERKRQGKMPYIYSIGDTKNDIEMFKLSDYKIAMKNGTPDLKALADFVTTRDNNNSGVASAIQKVFYRNIESDIDDRGMEL